MRIEAAMKKVREGLLLQRIGWKHRTEGVFIFLVPGATVKVSGSPLLGTFPEGTKLVYRTRIDMYTVDGTVIPWICNEADRQAHDWLVVDPGLVLNNDDDYQPLGVPWG